MKKIIILIAILVVIIVAAVVLSLGVKKDYSVDEIISLIEPKITENMSLKSETNVANDYDNLSNERTEIYLKSDKMNLKYYMAVENQEGINNLFQEIFLDFENKTQTNVLHYLKEISNMEANETFKNLITEEINSYREVLNLSQDTYQYCGKEDGIIKVSINVYDAFQDETKQYFYINEKEKTIEKVEIYKIEEGNENLYSTTTLSYSYDNVKDEDVNLDLTNYADYTVREQEF